MSLEIERRWLVGANVLWGLWPSDVPYTDSTICQTYLTPNPAHPTRQERVRVRVEGREAVTSHTVKEPTDQGCGVREETENIIPAWTYDALLKREDPAREPIYKERRVFEWKGRIFELDEIHTPRKVSILECELLSLDTEVELPPWIPILREVTNDPAWTNSSLCLKTYSPPP